MQDYFERLCEAAGVSAVDAEQLSFEDQAELIACLQLFEGFAIHHAQTRKPGHHIEIGFFAADDVNAFAATWEEQDAIAISWGVVTVFRKFFTNLMAADVMKWIGPEDREAAAQWFYDCAKCFVFIHELGHIWNGHTSLINNRGVMPFLYEISAFPDGKLGNLDRQTMEMDADGFAAANIFNMGVVVNKFPAVSSEIEDRFGEGATHLAMVAMATYLVFRMFDAAADFDDEALHAHPSPPLRQFIINGALIAQAAKSGIFSEKTAVDVTLTGVLTAEHVYAKAMGKKIDDSALKAAFSEQGQKFSRKLLRNWHVLRPQLDLLKRGGILPPVQDIPDDA